jgi:predicted HNH restriction endonuclease
MIRLWTYHPSTFNVDAPDLYVDHTLGKYWRHEETGFRYREVLPIFCAKIGTDQFLWCCQKRHCIVRMSEGMDVVEWELNIPSTDAIRFYRWEVWEKLIRSKTDDWSNLWVDDQSQAAADEIEPVVLLPLQPAWIRTHGPAPVKYPKPLPPRLCVSDARPLSEVTIVRVIKLSDIDDESRDNAAVDDFFTCKLREREGKFHLPRGHIERGKLAPKELLVFSYKGELKYIAESASELLDNTDSQKETYPQYFQVAVRSIVKVSGRLSELADALRQTGLLERTLQGQGWNTVSEEGSRREKLEATLSRFGYHRPIDERRYIEGERRASESTVRNPQLRADAKEKWGLTCSCCGFDAGEFYGDVATGCAIVHHLEIFDGQRREATLEHVQIVCANCHYVIHLTNPPMPIEELRALVLTRWNPWTPEGIERRRA